MGRGLDLTPRNKELDAYREKLIARLARKAQEDLDEMRAEYERLNKQGVLRLGRGMKKQ